MPFTGSRSQARYRFASEAPSLRVGDQHIFNRAKRRSRHSIEHTFDDGGNPGKRQTSFQESGDGNFIGGIERARQRPALANRLLRKLQARKLPLRDLLEIEPAQRRPIERTIIGRERARDR